jgi:lipopolysaccharide transport system ATP-binding protein
MNSIIEVKNLSKKYRISHQKRGMNYGNFREELIDAFKKPFRLLTDQKENKEDIWALKDINFSVVPGEILGIIGPNGAGKSTLLKVLTRITPPTKGEIIMRGRVSSLLEVGVGFHPELTGRENIYLNGAILGMTKKEINRKFDEIVDFSGIEKFLDTPVKRYSSGMYVRLAFSVAAHLEPEILLIDEVLAVGDAAFQKKSLGKMEEVSKSGRTVLFVSHNMGAIQQLTKRCLLLNEGNLILDGNTMNTIEAYMKWSSSILSASKSFKTEMEGFYIDLIKLDREQLEYGFNKPLRFDFHLRTEKNIKNLFIGMQIINSIGARIMTPKTVISSLEAGKNIISLVLENHYLPPGFYTLNIGMDLGGACIFYKTNILSFEISDIGIEDWFMVDRRDILGGCPPVKYYIQKIEF